MPPPSSVRVLASLRSCAAPALLLGLSLAIAAAAFTIVNALIWRPLPYPDAERLVTPRGVLRSWSPAMFDTLRRHDRTFTNVTGVHERGVSVTSPTGARFVRLEAVTSSYFDLLGVRPISGQQFSSTHDDWSVESALVLLSHGLWIEQFGGDARVLGRVIQVEGRAFTIAGVLPAGFAGLIGRTDVWVPLSMVPWMDGGAPATAAWSRWFEIFGLLPPNASVAVAQAQIAATAVPALLALPGSERGLGRAPEVRLQLLRDVAVTPAVRQAALMLLAAAALVLVLAAVNVAALGMSRAIERQRQFAIRLALGASRWRLGRTALAEALCIAASTAAIAAGSRTVLAQLLAGYAPPPSGFGLAIRSTLTADALGWDGRVFLFVAGSTAALLMVLLLWSLRVVLQANLEPLLRGRAPSTGLGRLARPTLRAGLVCAQMAIATAVAIACGVMLRSGLGLSARDRGIVAGGVTIAEFAPLRSSTEAARTVFFEQLVSSTAASPGIQAASIANCAPGQGRCRRSAVQRVDGVAIPERARAEVGVHFATPAHFRVLGSRIVRGREFGADRRGGVPVAIVSRNLAERLWPGQDAIGHNLAMYFANGRMTEDRTVVGVVDPIHYDAVDDGSVGDVFVPAAQASWDGALFVRSELPACDIRRIVSAAIARLDAAIPIQRVDTMQERLQRGLAPERFALTSLTVFAVAAIVLAGLGCFTMMRAAVDAGRNELVVRSALGARPSQLAGLVLARTAVLLVVGLSAGALLAFWLTAWLSALLHGVSTRDPAGFAVGLLAVALAIVTAASPAAATARAAARLVPRSE
jgi:predicted permease